MENGINLKKERVKDGYPHDETGRWIDCSYDYYTVEISGEETLLNFQHRLIVLRSEVSIEQDKLEAEIAREILCAKRQQLYLYNQWEVENDNYKALPWYKRIFTFAPKPPEVFVGEIPELNNKKESLNDLLELITKTTQTLNDLDFKYAVFIQQSKHRPPMAYTLMSKRLETIKWNLFQ